MMNRHAVQRFSGPLTLCATLAFGGSAAAAEEPDSYAVAALVGQEITVVAYQATVGSRLDRNFQQHIPILDDHFDRLATELSIGMIRDTLPTAVVQPVSFRDTAPFADSDALLPDQGLKPLLEAVQALSLPKDTQYVVLTSKFRSDARFKVSSGTIGSGKLTGLGFYIDADKRMKRTDTGASGRGFVPPFAYVTVSLIDLRTGTVVRSVTATARGARANVGPNTTLNPWDATTAEQKLRAFDNMLGRARRSAIPRVIAPA